MKKVLIVVLVLAALVLTGVLALRYFVTDWVTDRGGMENPDYTGEINMLDGDYTYVDNGALLAVIAGTWSSADGRYGLTLGDDCRILLTLDGKTVLEDQIHFTYLQPGYVAATEFSLDAWELKDADGTVLGEICSLRHEAGEDGGSILLEAAFGDGGSEIISFKQDTRTDAG